MQDVRSSDSPALCVGESLVDLICERPVDSLGRVALAGGAGEDAWGRWLQARLVAEGVDRPHRWSDLDEAVAVAGAACESALLVKVNAGEAALLTGERDSVRAAQALTRAGCRLALVTLGAEGAILRGEAAADVAGIRASVVDTTGAGDALLGAVLAALASSGYDPAAAAASIPAAVDCAARTTEHFGALE